MVACPIEIDEERRREGGRRVGKGRGRKGDDETVWLRQGAHRADGND